MSDYKPHVVIDEQKNIILPEELKNHMVQYDHNVKTITFDCPRYSDGRDLSTMRIYVNYFRTSGEKDADRCENITVDSKDNNLIHFEWVPKRSTTLEQGVLAFLICAEKEDAGGNQENAWHTKLCKDLKIAEGIDCLNAVIEKYPTIITYLLTRMEDVESIATPEAMQAYVNQYLRDYPPSGMTEEERALLEENFALTKQIQEDLAKTTQSKADAIICEAEGTIIVATDSSDAGFEGLSLYGKSKQGSTTGKNLFPYGDLVGMASVDILNKQPILLPAGTYTLYMKTDINDDIITTFAFYDADGGTIKNIGLKHSDFFGGAKTGITLGSDAAHISVYTRETVTLSNIQIELGSEFTGYEPYTGNKPSPNPEYPQEVVSVGNGGSIDGKVCGKNLLKYPYRDTTRTVNGITFTDNGDGTITVNGTATETAKFTLAANRVFKKGGRYTTTGCPEGGYPEGSSGSKYYISSFGGSDYGSGVTGTAKDDTKVYVQIGIKNGVTCNNLTFKPMIRLASIEDDTYEPYKEQTLTLQTPNGLPGIPLGTTIPDVIKNSPIHMSGVYWDNAEGQYYIADTVDGENGVRVQRIKEWTLDGAINANLSSSYGSVLRFDTNITSIAKMDVGLCDSLSVGTIGTADLECFNVHGSTGRILIQISSSRLATPDESGLIAYLKTNPMKFILPLATPIETPLSDEEILAYKALHTNKPTTTIMNSENVYMKCSYIADTKNHIKQNYIPLSKYTALEERVAAIEELVIS